MASTFLDPEDIAALAEDDPNAREVTVTVRLSAGARGRIGKLLDQFEALAQQAGIEIELDVPGYEKIWYGYAEVDGEAR